MCIRNSCIKEQEREMLKQILIFCNPLNEDYYSATQGIYGYKDEVVQEALEFLKQYELYFEDNLE
jgi:hypothetical protein